MTPAEVMVGSSEAYVRQRPTRSSAQKLEWCQTETDPIATRLTGSSGLRIEVGH